MPSDTAHASTPRLAWVGTAVPPALKAEGQGYSAAAVFDDSDEFLLSPSAFDHEFYIVELDQPGVSGLDLIRLIRRRSQAGLLAVGVPDDMVRALSTGADMLVPRTSTVEQLLAAVRAVQRRVRPGPVVEPAWILDDARALLTAPGGQDISLSESELLVMRCFAEAQGEPVPRGLMMQQLWGSTDASMDNALHATVYRLRRRIEQAGCPMAPIQSVSRVGYSFRAPLAWQRTGVVPPSQSHAGSPPSNAVVLKRHNVTLSGQGDPPLLMVHGYGCDQSVWRRLAPQLARRHRVALMDLAGYGGSPPSSYDFERHSHLRGHAQDILDVVQATQLDRPVLVGHSVGASAAVLAAVMRPEAFRALVLVAPSPSFLDDGHYHGGFSSEAMDQVLQALDADYLAWSRQMAPTIMGTHQPEDLQHELEETFCRAHPALAPHFARVAFLSDIRADLPKVKLPTLILQCTDDPLAPAEVGQYLKEHVQGSHLAVLRATGHCPHISAPEETAEAMEGFLAGLGSEVGS